MKVGILTYHYQTNYGGVLQAYALQKKLIQMGVTVELIDYRPYKLMYMYIRHLFVNRRSLSSSYFLKNAVKVFKFIRFIRSVMTLGDSTCYTQVGLRNQKNHYDCVLCGSDAIWGIQSHPGVLDFDSSYFLDFITDPAIRKVSYAASFGPTTAFDKRKNLVCRLLRQFEAISIRESSGVEILKRECGIQATHVLDPTFLIDFHDVMVEPHISNNYILLYGWFTPLEKAYIQSVAKENNLDIIAVGNPDVQAIAHLNPVSIGPEEWLGYFARATYIFTTFFHGMVFSLIFQKPFIVFDRPDKSAKTRSLLRDLNLTNRIVTKEELSMLQPDLYTIDFDNANTVIAHMRQESVAYLKNALNL